MIRPDRAASGKEGPLGAGVGRGRGAGRGAGRDATSTPESGSDSGSDSDSDSGRDSVRESIRNDSSIRVFDSETTTKDCNGGSETPPAGITRMPWGRRIRPLAESAADTPRASADDGARASRTPARINRCNFPQIAFFVQPILSAMGVGFIPWM